jgi:hypothetical protein
LHVLAGGNTSSVILTFRNFNASDVTADELLLTDTAIPNVQEYVLGANENSSSSVNMPAWNGGRGYVAGDVVVESSVVYLCLSGHTSSAIFTDDLAASRLGGDNHAAVGRRNELLQSGTW